MPICEPSLLLRAHALHAFRGQISLHGGLQATASQVVDYMEETKDHTCSCSSPQVSCLSLRKQLSAVHTPADADIPG